jgi:drug/metabolite transporter (DMT)-like permease
MVVATFFWGSLPVASKAVVAVVPPAQQSLVRSASAFLVLAGFCLVVAGAGPLRAALRRPGDLVVQGFLSFCGSGLTSLMSLQYISASLQAVLVSTFPLILALTALREGGPPALVGAAIALAGIVAVVGGDDPAAILAGGVDLRGVGLALLTALLIAGSQLWGQRTARRGDPMGTTAMAAGFGSPMLLAIGLAPGGVAETLRAPVWALWVLAYLGVFCTALNFGLWFWALKYVTAARAAPIQYLSTPISVLMAWWFLGEPLTLGLGIGTPLVLLGVWLTQAGRRRATGSSPS